MDWQFDGELFRKFRGSDIFGSKIIDDYSELDDFVRDYIDEDIGIISVSGEWKLPRGILVAPSPSGTPEHILWQLPHHVFPGGDRGPIGMKSGLEIRIFSDSRMDSKGIYVVRSRTKHSYYSIGAIIHFRFNTTNHPVPEFGQGGVGGATRLRHGNGGWREYPFVTSNYWHEGAAHFNSLLRGDIDAWLYVRGDRD